MAEEPSSKKGYKKEELSDPLYPSTTEINQELFMAEGTNNSAKKRMVNRKEAK